MFFEAQTYNSLVQNIEKVNRKQKDGKKLWKWQKKRSKKGKRRAAGLRNGSDQGHRPYMAIVA